VIDLSEDAVATKAVGIGYEPEVSVTADEMRAEAPVMAERLTKGLNGRLAFRTGKGRIGAGSDAIKPRDHIVAILGTNTLFVLRPTKAGFKLVGECYVDGIMFREILSDPHFHENGDLEMPLQLKAFDIV
jgi:hypothetical protein